MIGALKDIYRPYTVADIDALADRFCADNGLPRSITEETDLSSQPPDITDWLCAFYMRRRVLDHAEKRQQAKLLNFLSNPANLA